MRRIVIQFVAVVALALLFWWVSGRFSLPKGEQLFAAFLGAMIPLIIENNFRLWQLENKYKLKAERLRLRGKGDRMLASVQNAFQRLTERGGGAEDLYCKFYLDRISRLERHILNAADRDDLEMDENHQYVSESVLSEFDGKQTSVFRDVWIIDDHTNILDIHSLTYFTGLVKKIDEHKLLNIRSIFVVDGSAVESDTNFFRLLRYYHSNKKKMDYRILARDIYSEMFEDAGLEGEYQDFGIYGKRLMFRTISYEPSRGRFSRDADNIHRYLGFFENCWNQAAATQNEAAKSDPLKLADLVAKLDTKGKAV